MNFYEKKREMIQIVQKMKERGISKEGAYDYIVKTFGFGKKMVDNAWDLK